MSKVDNLFSSVNLADLISQETETKTTSAPVFEPVVNKSDFAEPRFSEPNPNENYDAEQEAKNLVYTLQGFEALVLPPIGVYAFNKKRGGKKAVENMRKAVTKQLSGKELTDSDQKNIDSYARYQADLKELESAFTPDQELTDRLIKLAMPGCEATQLHVNAWVGFGAMYSAALIGKIMKIIAA